jgi:hypothetical protein
MKDKGYLVALPTIRACPRRAILMLMKVGAVGTQPTKFPDGDFVVMAENNENSPSGFDTLTYKRIN